MPTGLDNVFADADRSPCVLIISAFDVNANAGGGARFAIDDPDFEVD